MEGDWINRLDVSLRYGQPGSTSGAINSGYQAPRYVRIGLDLTF